MAGLRSRPRRIPAPVLHPLPRQRVLDALRRRPRLTSLLVVCHGNICRSPFAAALLRRASARNGVRVDSAGFLGPGRPPPPEAVAAAARHGVDLSAHRSQFGTADRVRLSNLLVALDPP